MSDDDRTDEAPEFGPSGYLPDQAARRARKIILRAPLGLQWVVGALVLGVALVAAVLLLGRDTGPPGPPFAVLDGVVADAADLVTPTAVAAPDGTELDVVVLRVAGPRAFLVPEGLAADGLRFCDPSGLVEVDGTADTRAWRPSGRGVNGTPSLVPLATVVHDGLVYADPTAPGPPATPDVDGPDPACG